MLTFQKVENALKRARELQDIGNETAALHVLYSTIMNNRFRAQGWDSVKEQVMMRFVQFCVEKEKLKYVRDGLYQYRTISHHSNIASLGKVITELRDRAEGRLKAAKLTIGNKEMEKGDIEGDLEAEESPESLILCTLQIDVRDPAARAIHTPLRFVWETYKMIMDILKFSPKMEKLYHETARRACYFCNENERPMEFKRLCDGLRQNYTLLLKYKSKQESEALLRPELHLETRIAQLNVASELGLWRESANTAEDICFLGIHELFMKSFRLKADPLHKLREKLLKWLAIYYEKLAMVSLMLFL
ncbi:putative eukaryotic initiation factor-3 subunit 10 [Cardiosporidium cionae]|uniref:Eukaryotic initiation factor-3 subunit 10 n=1 Tax=Cardiosporidium cionae TaxID=476202 RepID=A0ABQ7J4G1_9APIC|nr:putative eukaryotic initiation factor-3 subunit 10 [Cardiosporidium cionae]|eukprot:KAF8817968.1 putative eukaryotic initiation factor-3 subunit 10 [Cardiosporidium cionae]